MKILIVGSGGREHAIAWKVAQSPLCEALLIAPGNAGTMQLGENIPIQPEDVASLVDLVKTRGIDLVIIGPEAALAAGLADALKSAGIRVFGPTRAAAEIETSKAFAKDFMQRHGIPTARFATFTNFADAAAYIDSQQEPVVIKASGLAAGKGVILPETRDEAMAALKAIMLDRQFGAAGDALIIEERLSGEEVSLLAFTDGVTLRSMPPAQDHKRLLDGDKGPNTGGMGAYCPAPVCPPEMVDAITRTLLQPVIDGLRAEGRQFSGVLYAGLILTERGPQVLEFNCRFGDPETQVLLPLLESDLVEIATACADGTLAEITPRWKSGMAATVVLASPGYPGHYSVGLPISGLGAATFHALAFQAGTRQTADGLVTAGGRVLNITGVGDTLREALDRAYQGIAFIHFDGMLYRKDIAHHALTRNANGPSAYSRSGVSIDAGNRAVALMKDAVRATYSPAVLAGIGAFGGLYDAAGLQSFDHPVLVASTDGVGTKVRLAAAVGRYDTIGWDIVNHCINDILVQGARPLFFLDYFATSHLEPEIAASIVSGIAAACQAAGCALLGGETAEMPGVYQPGEFDLAGTIVGAVERGSILPRADLCAGDLLVGLASSGPHTNGYSLIRKVFDGVPLDMIYPELGKPLSEVLLTPHRSYLQVLSPALALRPSPVKALAHLTGGGFIENIPRILPDGLRAIIHRGRWPVPPLFGIIQQRGQISNTEMPRVFNLGIGMVAIVAPDDLPVFQNTLAEPGWVIGELAKGVRGAEVV